MEWLNENAQAISAVASIFTLFVWVFYAQLLYNGYVRQRRPRVIINRGQGTGVDAICLISNMSSEAIYIQHLVAVLHTQNHSYNLDVVEYQQRSSEQHENRYRTHQGPLASGDYLNIQSFGDIVNRLKRIGKLRMICCISRISSSKFVSLPFMGPKICPWALHVPLILI